MFKVFLFDACIKIIVFLSVDGIVPNEVIGFTVARGWDECWIALIALFLGSIVTALRDDLPPDIPIRQLSLEIRSAG